MFHKQPNNQVESRLGNWISKLEVEGPGRDFFLKKNSPFCDDQNDPVETGN